MLTKNQFRVSKASVMVGAFFLLSCSKSQSPEWNGSTLKAQSANFKLSLTDAPAPEIRSVIVNIKHAELILAKGGKQARVKVANDLGDIDLLQLRNGVTLPMAEMSLPHGVDVKQIRLILEENGNYIVKSDDSTCELQTPSAQNTGVKLLISKTVRMEPGFNYEVIVDFDAERSVVLKGNGGCLLKPVLKLKSALRNQPGTNPEEIPDDSNPGTDPGADPDADPWEPVDSGDLPPDVPPATLPEFFNN